MMVVNQNVCHVSVSFCAFSAALFKTESFATRIKFVANKTKLSGGNSATFFSDDEFFLSAAGVSSNK
ncbi:hypothetical protein [Rahnella selenatireducens]|uniref:hypothetical protein n=1 Tax=Rahnella selenatireducens TaxID=3389797 RepID=UPI003968E898